MTKKDFQQKTAATREKYGCYKVGDIAARLSLSDLSEADISYIMQGGEEIQMRPYPKLQAWLDGAMDRLEERVPIERAVEIRQASACCLTGARETLARKIHNENTTIESRFEALSKARQIIGGNAWREFDDYFISFWYAKPADGYKCVCLKCVPDNPMNKLWCECCAGHIKHHFETALGVRATCTCLASILNSCGKDACLFKLNIIDKID